jgi:phosphate transport system ATP-binding protein
MTGSDTILSVKNLNVHYGEFKALKNISLDFTRNKVTALIGPSGCGKSTLLKCLNRMNDLVPEAKVEGEVTFENQDIYEAGIDPAQVRLHIGMVFQKPNPFPKTIFNNVAFGLKLNGFKGDIEEVVETSLRQAALWDEVKDRLHKSAMTLSGGQQQRLCIARTLAVEPQVILMDEPASALDPIGTIAIENLMRDLADKYSIIVVTHNMQQAARVSDYTAFLMMDDDRAGYLVESGETDAIFQNPQDERTEAYITGRFG